MDGLGLLAFWNTKPSSGECAIYLSLVNIFLGKVGQQQFSTHSLSLEKETQLRAKGQLQL